MKQGGTWSTLATSDRSRARLLRLSVMLLILAWITLVIANYYTQLWHLVLTDNISWIGPGDIGLPALSFVRPAMIRAVWGIVSAAALLANAVLLGTFICCRLRIRFVNLAEVLPAAASLGIGVFAFSGLLLVQIGQYRVGVVRLLIVLPLCASGIWWLLYGRELRRPRCPHVAMRPTIQWLWVLGSQSADLYLTRAVASYGVWQFANHTLPLNARVLTWTGGDDFYSRRDRIWASATVAQPIAWARTGQEAQALSGLPSLGITHLIIVEQNGLEPDEQMALTSQAFVRPRMTACI